MVAQISSSAVPLVRSKVSQVTLMPWDPESDAHVERMRLQRVACGWKEDSVLGWRDQQRQGSIALQWVVLSDSDPEKEAKEATHVAAFPGEKEVLQDSASSFGGQARVSTTKNFLPVGHICLNDEYETPGMEAKTAGLYWISNFYVSQPLQGTGLGRAAMDTVEQLATSEPLRASILALSTAANWYPGRADKKQAMGWSEPKVSNEDWYTRRGYEIYKRIDKMWWQPDHTGKLWPTTAIFMKKEIK